MVKITLLRKSTFDSWYVGKNNLLLPPHSTYVDFLLIINSDTELVAVNILIYPEEVVHSCTVKNLFLKILQTLQEST